MKRMGSIMNTTITTYGSLMLAIIFEVIGTSFLKQSDQFSRLGPTLITAASYAAAFYCLSITLKTIPVGIAYAIWSGVGIVLISIIGLIFFKQNLDLAACTGLGLIVAGVVVVNVFSKSVVH